MARRPTPAARVQRVAIYLRVSTQDQARGESLETQLAQCRDYCAGHGWEVAGEYVDVMTGRRADRPRYQALKADRGYDAVVVWRIDRLGRNEAESFGLLSELAALGKTVVSATEAESNTSPLLRAIKVVLAAEESRQLADRIRPTMQRRAEAGHWQSPAPYGYRLVAGVLTPCPAEAEIVREIVRLYLEGAGVVAIAQALNARAAPPPRGRAWFGRTIALFLRNPAYVGMVNWAGRTYPGRHEPLVDRERWEAVQAELARRTWLGRPRHGEPPAHLLTGFVRCDGCGHRMVYQASRRRGRELAWFRCSGRMNGHPCANRVWVRADRAEAYVVALLARPMVADSGALVRRARAAGDAAATDGERRRQARRAALEREIATNEARLARLRTHLADGLVTEAEYRGDRRRYMEALDGARAEMAGLGAPAAPVVDEASAAAFASVVGLWSGVDLARRRELLALLELAVIWDGQCLSHRARPEWTPYLAVEWT